ncbi:hypothetical protein [Fimbriiglobus ruber]|uniref:Uncharacterized protein n=1 Tax=Fimbriiglobus ruber TaxID=1908690 RepID=A0A225E5U1_9BACT|nr:hypothetical protein [Fimbriiglobus ruber]OWK45476.1 hypothetical protein FRUB_01807 [Fimbriiglobus ruber]
MDKGKADGGMRRAITIGLVAYAALMAYLIVRAGELPRAEHAGELFGYFLIPAGLTGWLARGRRWSWLLIAAVYVAFAAAMFVVVVGNMVAGKK